jgi:diadenosine tetraphosphate (Ap4A) HIT family hydrolase
MNTLGATPDCELCALQGHLRAADSAVSLGDGWWVNEAQGNINRPRFVIQNERHRDALGAMTLAESTSMGRVISRLDRALTRHPRVEKVYFESFNETPGGHPHIHIIPRYADESAIGPGLMLTKYDGADFGLQDLAPLLRQTRARSFAEAPIVARFRAPLAFWNRHLSPYPLFARLTDRGVFRDQGTAYEGTWLLILITLCLVAWFTALPSWLFFIMLALALYRFVDVGVYVASMLLSGGTRLKSPGRSLILFLGNLIELACVAFLVGLALGEPRDAALSAAVSFVSTQGLVIETASGLVLIALGMFNLVYLLVIASGISLVIGKIGESFTSNVDHNQE